MHVASEVQKRSVGENRSPFPLLSSGASVSRIVLLWSWIASHLRLPEYFKDILVIVVFFFKTNIEALKLVFFSRICSTLVH